MGEILPCCKFISFYLNSNLLNKVDFDKFRELYKDDFKMGFHKHYYNSHLQNFVIKGM